METNLKKSKFFLKEKQTNELCKLGVNVDLGSCVWQETDLDDNLSFVEKRTFILQDMLEILQQSGIKVSLALHTVTRGADKNVVEVWVVTTSGKMTISVEGDSPLDATYLAMLYAADGGFLAKNFYR